MKTIVRRHLLQESLDELRGEGKRIGFVPTMGALHKGHIALVKRARAENEVVVASIFVNPTQFNNPGDLTNYPRTFEKDSEMLEQSGCDLLFFPEVAEMYPDGFKEAVTPLDLGGLDLVMEGAHRPGHFAGVVQVVKKLFDAVGPCKAYFGEKDFQQLAIVRKMVREWKLPVEVIGCPIVREADGLAMSSRNMRLLPEERKVAPKISQAMFRAKEMWPSHSAGEIKAEISRMIGEEKLFRLEYFEIVDTTTLQAIPDSQKTNAIACIAVHLGAVRLIDNIILNFEF